MAEKKEIIVLDEMYEGVSPDMYVCECGNSPSEEGFHPCLEDGTNVEPESGSGWVDLYKCDRCEQIYRSMNG